MISVVIPVLDGMHVLDTTLPAVERLQGVAEVVWVDDGSMDGTGALLAEACLGEAQRRVVTFPTNRGRSAARNAGMSVTTGDVVVFFDVDVEPSPETALRLAEAATRPGAVAAVARLHPVATDPDEPYQDYVVSHPRGPDPAAPLGTALDWRFFLSGACAIRRDVLLDAGGFPPDVAYGEDVALACRLSTGHPTGLRRAAAIVRLHDLGDLPRALGHAAAFGRAAARIPDCAEGPLRSLQSAAGMGWMAPPVSRALQAMVRRLGPGPMRRKAVRYLLASTASTALAAARRA